METSTRQEIDAADMRGWRPGMERLRRRVRALQYQLYRFYREANTETQAETTEVNERWPVAVRQMKAESEDQEHFFKLRQASALLLYPPSLEYPSIRFDNAIMDILIFSTTTWSTSKLKR